MTDAATKAALNHMTKRLALSLAPQRRVHAIAPSLVDTPMSQAWTTAHKRWQDRAPIGRGNQPAAIAQVASLLLASHSLTGASSIADGGLKLT